MAELVTVKTTLKEHIKHKIKYTLLACKPIRFCYAVMLVMKELIKEGI